MNRDPLVGIATPVYNGEPYLQECIESVLKQTYTNWEYIIVNNGSTDRSLEIAQDYAAADPRIRVHNNEEFLSQLRNFNVALSLVSPRSSYYKIVMADDWLFPECLERMVRLAEENPTVGLVSSYQIAGNRVQADGFPFPSSVLSGREVCRIQLLDGLFFFGSHTSILMRGEVVRSRSPYYDESAIFGDTDACYAVLREWDFGFVHQVLSFTRTDNESITSRIRHFLPHELNKFIVLMNHGRNYLEPSEFERFFRWFRRRYFRRLARGLLSPRGLAKYRFHRAGLKTVGYDLTLLKLSPYILSVLMDMALNPKNTAAELRQDLNKALKRFRVANDKGFLCW